MPALLEDRDRRGHKARVRKGPHRNGDVFFVAFLDVEDRRAASRTESKSKFSAFTTHPNELVAFALYGHRPARETRLRAEDAAGSALASVAMADGDTDRFSENLRPELTATARCKPKCHRDSYVMSCSA